LVFDRLDPEVGGEVGEVSDDGDERFAGANVVPAFVDFAIEVGDDGDEHVGWIFAPGGFEEFDHWAVESFDRGLEDAEEGGGAEGPAVLEERVVLLLNADAGEAAEDVELVGEFLELDEVDLPRALLLGDDGLESYGGVAVSATGVMKKDMNFFHERNVAAIFRNCGKALTMPCG
jgi:hypothetical protein